MKFLQIILVIWASNQIVAQYNFYYKINTPLQVRSSADDGCKRSVEFSIRETQDFEGSPEHWFVDYYMEKKCNNAVCGQCVFVQDRIRNDFGTNGVITRSVAPKGFYGYFKTRNGGFWTSGYHESYVRPIFQIGKIMKVVYNNEGAMSSYIDYNGEFLYVPTSQTYPKLNTPNNNGVISGTTASLVAPDFLINNFNDGDLFWEVKSGTRRVYFGYGYTATFQMSEEAKCQNLTVMVTAKNGYEWESSVINFEFRPLPNLELGKSLVIVQPQCTEAQQAMQPWKTEGYVKIANEALDKKYKITILDKDNNRDFANLDNLISFRELKKEYSPYKLVCEEDLGNNVSSCPQTFENIVIIPPSPITVIESNFTDIRCFGEQPSYTITVDGNTNKFNLLSNDTSIATLSAKQSQKIMLNKGSKDYKFEIVDENLCRYEQTLNFAAKEPTKLEATLIIDTAVCFRGHASVQILAKGGTIYDQENPYRYAFWPATGTQLSSSFATKGGATVYPRVYDKNNCAFNFHNLTLSNPKDFRVKVIEHINNICPKATQGKLVVGSISEDQWYTYTYAINGEAFSKDSLFGSLSSNTYKISVQNQYGCQKDTNLSITQPPIIQIHKTALDSVRCFGESNGALSLSITGGTGKKRIRMNNESLWTLGVTYTFSHTYDSLPEQIYWLHAEDSLGCKDSTSYSIRSKSHIIHAFSKSNPSCDESSDGSLSVAITGGKQPYTHTWLERPELGDKLQHLSLHKGTYVLQSTDYLNCIKIDTFQLIAPPALQVHIQGYPLLCKGQRITLDAGPGASHKWGGSKWHIQNGSKSEVFEGGTYWVEVQNESGCIGRDTFIVKQSDTLLKADFLVATHIVKGDTVVLVNINPKIDSIKWNINPSYMVPVGKNLNKTTQQVVFTTYGENYVEMEGYYKGCRDIKRHRVFVINASERNKYDKQIGIKTSIIHSCHLFPNPNDGGFEIDYELNEEGVPLTVTLSSTTTGAVVRTNDLQVYPDNKIRFEEDLPEGAYIVHIKARDEVIAVRFLIAYD